MVDGEANFEGSLIKAGGPASEPPLQSLTERHWGTLLRSIEQGRCTPFLGSETCFGAVPNGSDIAAEWAGKYGYPLDDTHDLARVAQFLATDQDPLAPKDLIRLRLQDVAPPAFTADDEPHSALADLPLPVYVTTTFFDFMVQALKSPPRYKNAQRDMCRWTEALRAARTPEPTEPTVANPLVFHLHGYITEPESLVLTEDDYLDFLVNTSKEPELIPLRVRKAFTTTSLLFLGYRLADLEFRVLLRSLVSHLKINPTKAHMSVQLVAGNNNDPTLVVRAQEYLGRYCQGLDIAVYWGTSRQFVSELRKRWNSYKGPQN